MKATGGARAKQSENFVVTRTDSGLCQINVTGWVGPPQMRFPADRADELAKLIRDFDK